MTRRPVFLLVSAALLAACAKPPPVRVLRIAYESDALTLDPMRFQDDVSRSVQSNVYAGLVRFDGNLAIVPVLAAGRPRRLRERRRRGRGPRARERRARRRGQPAGEPPWRAARRAGRARAGARRAQLVLPLARCAERRDPERVRGPPRTARDLAR